MVFYGLYIIINFKFIISFTAQDAWSRRGRVITEQLDVMRECLLEVGASPGGEQEQKRMSVLEVFIVIVVS